MAATVGIAPLGCLASDQPRPARAVDRRYANANATVMDDKNAAFKTAKKQFEAKTTEYDAKKKEIVTASRAVEAVLLSPGFTYEKTDADHDSVIATVKVNVAGMIEELKGLSKAAQDLKAKMDDVNTKKLEAQDLYDKAAKDATDAEAAVTGVKVRVCGKTCRPAPNAMFE